MSDLQANVPSLSEQNPSEGDQAAQTDTIASTNTNQEQEGTSNEKIDEPASIQASIDASTSEQLQNTSTISQPDINQAKSTSEDLVAGEQQPVATEALSNAQAESTDVPTTSILSEPEPESTVPPADVVQTDTTTDDTEKQQKNERSENASELESFTVKQEELQKQEPIKQVTANQEAEEGEVEQQGTADALEAAALESQTNEDAHPTAKPEEALTEVKTEPLHASSQMTQNGDSTEHLDQPNTNEASANEAMPSDLASQQNVDDVLESVAPASMGEEQKAQSTLEPHQTRIEDVEMKEIVPETHAGDAVAPSVQPFVDNENVETTPAQPTVTSQEPTSGAVPDQRQNRITEEPIPRSTQETISAVESTAPEPNPASATQEDVSTPVTRPRTLQRLSQELTPSSTNVNGHSSGPSGRNAGNARQDEMSRIRKENEDMRLLWLSLPSHDHPSYYSDTDEENASSGSSCAADALLPRSVAGRAPYLNGDTIRQKRKQDQWCHDDRVDESDLEEEEDAGRSVGQNEKQYRIGNRGNKLKKNSRWVRKHKLGTSTDARNEKDITERFTDRLKALQRTQVESMLNNAPGPPLLPIEADMLDGSDRLLLKDIHNPPAIEETSILLAPQLLRPILSTRALLQSHTLRHTFRNPHIGALSRTALDLRESESQISRSLTRCLKAMEKRISNKQLALVNGDSTHFNGILPSQSESVSNIRDSDKEMEIDPHAVGVEGTQGTDDELNPSFAQLDRLFVTKEGLPIPFGGQGGEEGEVEMARQGLNGNEQQTILTADQQREVIRAALECLHELGGDSLEYVERLEEVRSRLAAVKQKRLKVWNALRIWALKREGDDFENENGAGVNENDSLTEAAAAIATNQTTSSRSGQAGNAKPNSTTNPTSTGTKRRRVAA